MLNYIERLAFFIESFAASFAITFTLVDFFDLLGLFLFHLAKVLLALDQFVLAVFKINFTLSSLLLSSEQVLLHVFQLLHFVLSLSS